MRERLIIKLVEGDIPPADKYQVIDQDFAQAGLDPVKAEFPKDENGLQKAIDYVAESNVTADKIESRRFLISPYQS